MKKALIALAVLLVVLVTAALVGPSFVDWNRYKGTLAAAIEDQTGRRFAIGGTLSLRLLPQPTLTARNVRLANMAGGSAPDMLTLSGLQVLVGLGPLLRGEVEVRSLRLVEPVLLLERLADGRVNWDFAPKSKLPGNAAPLPRTAVDAQDAAPIALQELVIIDGRITWHDATTGTREQVEDVDLTLNAASLDTGPYTARGTLRARGLPLSLSASVGDLTRPVAPVGLELAVTGGERLQLALRGSLADARGTPRFQGKLEGDAARLSALAAALGKAGMPLALPPPLAGQALAVRADVAGGRQDLAVNALTLQLGETRGTGAATIALDPRVAIDATLAFGRLDLDPWMAAAGAMAEPARVPADAAPAAGPVAKPAARPPGVEATLTLTADFATLRGGMLRQVDVHAAWRGAGVELRRLAAVLPGNTEVALAGRIAPDAATRFAGTLDAQTPDLRALLGWAGLDAGAVPADRLRQASLRTALRVTPAVVEAQGIDLKVDASQLTGSGSYALRARPSFSLDAVIDRLNADAYRPAPASPGPAAAGTTGAGSAAANTALPLGGFDADLRLRVDALTYEGYQLRDAVVDAGLLAGTLTLRTARVGDVGGLRAAVTGTVGALPATPDLALAFSAAAPDAGALLRLMGRGAPPSTARGGALSLEGTLRGSLPTLAVDVTARTGPGSASAEGRVTLGAKPEVDLALRADHPQLVTFLNGWGIDYRPAAGNLGALRLAAKLSGAPDRLSLSDIDATLGPLNLLGEASLDSSGARPKLAARLEGSEILLDLFLPREAEGNAARTARGGAGGGASSPPAAAGRWSTDPIDFSLLQQMDAEIAVRARALRYGAYRFVDPRFTLVAQNGIAQVAPLTGTLFGGAVKLDLRLDATAVPAIAAKISIDNGNLEDALGESAGIDRLTGRGSLEGDLTARGRDQAEMVGSLAGTMRFAARDGVVRGIDLRALSDRLKELDRLTDFLDLIGRTTGGGQTRYTSLTGSFQIERGIARTSDLAAQFEAGTGSGEGVVDLPNWRIDLQTVARLTEHPNAPTVGLDLKGPLDSPVRDIRTRDLEAFLGQRLGETVLRRLMRRGGAEPVPPAAPAPQATPAQPRLPGPLGDVLQDVLRRSRK